jgi:hypothetical protein
MKEFLKRMSKYKKECENLVFGKKSEYLKKKHILC